MTNSIPLISTGKKIFLLCWGAYTLAYLGRINLSLAIPILEQVAGLDKAKLGLIASSFFWVYAFGQLVNGRLGDMLNNRIFIFTGLLLSAFANIAFGYTENITIMIIIWGANGYFQSILWGSLIKTLHIWFPEGKRAVVGLYIFSSVLAGFILAWGFLPVVAEKTGWRNIFFLPGIIIAIYAFIWLFLMKSKPEYSDCSTREKILDRGMKKHKFRSILKGPDIVLIALCALFLGFVREGISLWIPAILTETFSTDLKSVMETALLIPIFNFAGIFAARLIIKKFYRREAFLISLFCSGACGVFILLFLFPDAGLVYYILSLGLSSMFLYCATSVITSVIPLYSKLPSSLAGFFDFSIYAGAGISGIVSGFVSKNFGWDKVFLTWIVFAGIAAMLSAFSVRFGKSRQSKKN